MLSVTTRDGETLVITSDDLPRLPSPGETAVDEAGHAGDILPILDAVSAPMQAYFLLAGAYHARRLYADFEAVCAHATAPPFASVRSDPESRAVLGRLFVSLAAHELSVGSSSSRALAHTHSKDFPTRFVRERHRSASGLLATANSIAVGLAGVLEHLTTHGYAPCNDLKLSIELATAAASLFKSNVTDSDLEREKELLHASALADAAFKFNRHSSHALALNGPELIPALAVTAIVSHRRGDLNAARSALVRVIKAAPTSTPASVRVALGYVLESLGWNHVARAAFARAVQVEPDFIPALIAVSQLDLRTLAERPPVDLNPVDRASRDELIASIFTNLKHALRLEPGHPRLLVTLSHAASTLWRPVPCTATVTRGSRFILLSADMTARFRSGETVRLGVVAGEAFIPVQVRIATVSLAPVAAFTQLARCNRFIATLVSETAARTESRLCVLKSKSPWGLSSATGITLMALESDNAIALARNALTAVGSHTSTLGDPAVTSPLKSECHYALARALHMSGDVIGAGIHYRAAVESSPNHAPALHGMATVAAFTRRWEEADSICDKILALRHDDRSACRLSAALALLHPRAGADDSKYVQALERAHRAHEAAPWDALATCIYSGLLLRGVCDSKTAAQRAYKVTETAVERMKRSGLAVPAPLWNACGVACLRLAACEMASGVASSVAAGEGYKRRMEHCTRAVEAFTRAHRSIAQEMHPGMDVAHMCDADAEAATRNRIMFGPAGVTIAFNMGRAFEMQGNDDAAERMYSDILTHAPTYYDAALRRAIMAVDIGNEDRARDMLVSVITTASALVGSSAGSAPSPAAVTPSVAHARWAYIVANVILAQMHERQHAPSAAMEAYQRALAVPGAQAEAYTSLCMANLTFKNIYNPSSGEDRDETLRKAWEIYKETSKRFPTNLYAANGLACVKAEQGSLAPARDVFAFLRECDATAAPVSLNLAHTYVGLGHTHAAVQLYGLLERSVASTPALADAVLPRAAASHSDARTHAHSLAPASLAVSQARAHMDVHSYNAAIASLRRAAMDEPGSLCTRFNVAFVCEEEAVRVIGLQPNERTLGQVETAVEMLRHATHSFTWLRDVMSSPISAQDGSVHSGSVDALVRAGVTRDRIAWVVSQLAKQMPVADVHLADARARAARVAADAQTRAARAAAREAEKAAAAAAEKEAAARTAAQREAAAQALQAGLAATEEQVAAAAPATKGRKGKKKARMQLPSGLSSDEDNGPMLNDDDDVQAAVRRTVAEVFGEEDEDDAAGAPAKGGDASRSSSPAGSSSSSSSSGSSSSSSDSDSDSDSSSSSSSSGAAGKADDSVPAAGEAAPVAAPATDGDVDADAALQDIFGEDSGGEEELATAAAAAVPSPASAGTKRRAAAVFDDDD